MKRLIRLALAATLLCSLSAIAADQGSPDGAYPNSVKLLVGKSQVITAPVPLTRVLSSNPNVVDTLGISPTQIAVEAKAAGSGSLILWDQNGHSQIVDVSVDLDLAGLQQAIKQAYPDQQVAVRSDGGRLIVSGTVSDPVLIEIIGRMAAQYSTQVVNSLTLSASHDRQVLLEVKFAEVDRTKVDQLGFNFFSLGAANTLGAVSTQQFGPPLLGGGSGSGSAVNTPAIAVSDLLNIFLFRPDINFGTTIKALQQKNVLQVLAEPNLLALNGQKASFLSGGEFPFPVVQGGANVGAVTIQFRPFGVRLDFTAYTSDSNVIRLHVAPEVSTLDYTNALTISGFVVPAISTRKAETEVELKDGQSFGIAGLLDRRAVAQLDRVPGIGDIPILGELFRSRNITRSNAELIVLVTPHIVDPIKGNGPVPAEPKPSLPYLKDQKFDTGVPGHQDAAAPSQPESK